MLKNQRKVLQMSASRVSAGCVLLMLCALNLACNRTLVQGQVVDVQGAALPGVTVRATGADAETLSDGLGQYSLTVNPDVSGLDFLKNGYTSGHLELPKDKSFSLAASKVSLWCLPQNSGVYIFENFRYRRTSADEPERFGVKNTVVFGAARLPDLESTESSEPLLISYKMPPYDLHMSRLHAIQAMSSQAGRGLQDAWIQETAIPIETIPIDEPERQLLQIHAGEPLAPGIYAIHWGALEGHSTTDPRIFMFKVYDPSQPEQPQPPPEPQKEEPKQKTKPKSKPEPKPEQPAPAPPQDSVIDTGAADAEGAAPATKP